MAMALDAQSLAERLQWEQQDYWLHLEAASELDKYPAKQHARRVVEKLGVDDGLIYLPGEPARNNEDSDMPAPFRQRRYFYYLSGCNEPNCHLTYDIQNDTLTLFVPRIDPRRVIWNGRGSTPAEALDKYDIDTVLYIDQLPKFITNWARYYRGSLYILHPSQNPLIPGIDQPIDSESLQPAMNLTRVIKDDHEIKLIKKANDISSLAHKEILANILKFKNEAQVEGLFLDVCISKQAKQQAYDIIAASGPNAGTLHYDDNDQDFEDRQLMCLDAGCEWQLYASDITRTFPLSGKWPSEEARQIYKLVQRMQEKCIQKLAPGIRYLDLHIMAHQIAIDGLLKLGIFHNGTKEEIYKAGTSRAFFPHGLGHHVGLEVHDVGQADLMSIKKGKASYEKAPSLFPEDFHLPVYDNELCRSPADPQSGHLETGMIVTVEPGIYFSTYALNMFYLPHPVHSKFINTEVLVKYLPVGGVRIEDDILITTKGYENLTTAPKGEAMLEIIRSRNSDSADLRPAVRSLNLKTSVNDREEPLRRAPGISRYAAEPILKPIERATTMPMEGKGRKSVDFEPFDGPSLFSGFRRASTIDVTGKNMTTNRASLSQQTLSKTTKTKERQPRTPVCGDETDNAEHAYLGFAAQLDTGKSKHPSAKVRPTCRKCTILVQTMERLRQNLSRTEQEFPKLEKLPGQSPKIGSTEAKAGPEMEQMTHNSTSIPGQLGPSADRLAPDTYVKKTKEPYRKDRARFDTNELYQRLTALQAASSPNGVLRADPIINTAMPSATEYQKQSCHREQSQTLADDSSLHMGKDGIFSKPHQVVGRSKTLPTAVESFSTSSPSRVAIDAILKANTSQHAPASDRRMLNSGPKTLDDMDLPASRKLNKQPTMRPSLPAIRAHASNNPWTGSNRHSVANPPSKPNLLSARPEQARPGQNITNTRQCYACRENGAHCDCSPDFPCHPCSFCTQQNLICNIWPPSAHTAQRSLHGGLNSEPSHSSLSASKGAKKGGEQGRPMGPATHVDSKEKDTSLGRLQEAMDHLWQVKQEMDTKYDYAWSGLGDGGEKQAEDRKEWVERVERDLRRNLIGTAKRQA